MLVWLIRAMWLSVPPAVCLLKGMDAMLCCDTGPISISAASASGKAVGLLSASLAGSGARGGAGTLSGACAAAAVAAAGAGAVASKLQQRSGGLAVGVGSGGGSGVAGRGARQLLGCNSNSTEEEGMMFDLEEDAAGARGCVCVGMCGSCGDVWVTLVWVPCVGEGPNGARLLR